MEEQIWNYVIGDIHGCYDELLQLEEKIYYHAVKNGVKPYIISVGDLIDRGPKSKEVVEHFRLGNENLTHSAVMGNHELMMLEAVEAFSPDNFNQKGCTYPDWFHTYKNNFERGKGFSRFLLLKDYMITTRSLWMSQGGYNTLISYNCELNKPKTWMFQASTISFLLNLPFFWENAEFIVTHALALSEDLKSVKAFKPLLNNPDREKFSQEQIEELRKSTTTLVWNRNIPKLRPDMARNHVSGHTPVKTVKKHNKISCTQIDTGCVFGGRLTALCLEADKLISVKARKNYLA